MACQGFQWLDSGKRSFSPVRGQTGSFLDRPVCVLDKQPTTSLLQLAIQPRSPNSGCPITPVEGSSGLYVSALLTNYSLPGEDQGQTSKCSVSGTSVEQPALVSHSNTEPSRLPDPVTASAEHSDELRGRDSSSSTLGTSTTSRLAHFRRSWSSEGLSDGVIELIGKSWRNSTESSYSSAWRQWDCWCFGWGVDPFSAPLKDIFQAGKQCRTINSMRSAISMSHTNIDGARIRQHPLVTRLLKGVFNSRPPAPWYTTTWNISSVLTFIDNSSENRKLLHQDLTHKVAMLMVSHSNPTPIPLQ